MALLKKISGSKTVIVPITTVGNNYLPFIEDLKDKVIKYIDFVPMAALPYTADTPATDSSKYIISLANKTGNTYDIQDVPLGRFDLSLNWGLRPAIMRKLSLQNSYIFCSDASEVGKAAVLVFYYDYPEYSRRNTTIDVAVNAFEVPVLSAVQPNNFPDNRTMVGKRFRNLMFTDVTLTPNLRTAVSGSDADKIYISLYKGNFALLDTIPLPCLCAVNMVEQLEFSNIQFDFTNSYALVGGAGANSALVGKSLFLNASYEN